MDKLIELIANPDILSFALIAIFIMADAAGKRRAAGARRHEPSAAASPVDAIGLK